MPLLRQTLFSLLPVALTVLAVLAGLGFFDWWLLKRHRELGSEARLPRQLAMLALTGIGIVIILLMLPVDTETRNHLLTILGLVTTAIMALSSTSLVANAMASLMLRTTHSFRAGDFLRVGEHFGRVTERGLLHTEIQTESRELTTLPNSFLIANPYTVVRTSGTLVSTDLSLGYDVAVATVEPLLLEAAKKTGLEEPFVRVMKLGDFSITYQVSGFLSEIKHLLSARSKLCRAVIETLHGAGVEIVSPAFMNQRRIPEGMRFIPEAGLPEVQSETQLSPEVIMFDKADEAEKAEEMRGKLESELKILEQQASETNGDDRKRIQVQIEERKKQLAELEKD